MSKNFGLIGVAGYIAPRHLRAIRDTGNRVIVAVDKSDNVGIIDSYFPNAAFFTEFERFDRHVERLKHDGEDQRLHYVSICSPNYLHDAHIRFALRAQTDAICEKPLVLNPWNVDALGEIEKETGRRINTILQLRLHPVINALRETVLKQPPDKVHEVDLSYITGRGNWYQYSWKGAEDKSGGIATNIGIHFFDMLIWIFGRVRSSRLHLAEANCTAGCLELERARVRWFLSLDTNDLPGAVAKTGNRSYRSLRIDGEELEFSEGFTDLHTRSYEEILKGRGFGLSDVRASIEAAYTIRHAELAPLQGDYHPWLKERREKGN
jgi:UDP-N-acetyl-2-amino-2-deoxyglucuronate dehydrogenase